MNPAPTRPPRLPPPRAVSAVFRRIRARRSWTQETLAAELGVTKAAVNNIERGRRWPSGRVLWAALGLEGGGRGTGGEPCDTGR